MSLATAAKRLGCSKPTASRLLAKAGRERVETREIAYVLTEDVEALLHKRDLDRFRQAKQSTRKVIEKEIDPETFDLVEIKPKEGTRKCKVCGKPIPVGRYLCPCSNRQFLLDRESMGDIEGYKVGL